MMPHVMEAMEEDFTVHRLWEAEDRDALLAEVGERVRAVGTSGNLGASAALMDALPNLEIVGCYGVGVDSIDLQHAAKRKVIVTNTPDVLNDDVANMAIALLLATSRRICVGDRYVRDGKWLKAAMPLTHSIRGKQLGILGLGRIGKDIAEKASAFGLELSYHGRRKQDDVSYRFFDNLVEMAENCDYLVAICPGGEATNNIVNRAVMDALGPEGVLINVARGTVVDEAELVLALQEGRLGGAGLDVFLEEPKVPEALFEMDQVVLQPHAASATVETRHAMGDLVVKNLRAHFAGQPVLTPVR
ncbi:2-hydroxyacid dehydrogenase [Pelagibius litoralis]|uniref:2-hydroxyacid dehydrogenase n=2 Tax=Pelagibius litoralis TaxID=374515 RepID=A0A967EVP8_9PROT|nr:2-hydroxyacid dehydrogenase [Pelagibius litoralis]